MPGKIPISALRLSPSLLHSQSLNNHTWPYPSEDRPPASVLLCQGLIARLSGLNKTIAQVMLSTGCRAREVLNIRICDISVTGHLFIRALKKSQSRMVYYPSLISYAHPQRHPNSHLIFGHHSYDKYYRSIIQLLPANSPRSSIRLKVSNLFRVAAADMASSISRGHASVPSIYLGHKSPRSTTYYLTQKEKSDG